MIPKTIAWFVLAVVAMLFVNWGWRMFEDKMIYYPERAYTERPERLKLPFEDVSLQASDGVRLHAWWIGDPRHKRTVLFLHGNAGNIGDRLDRVKTLGDVPVRFFLLDYRGYGESEGKPSEEGLYQDAEAAYAYLREKRGIPSEDIVLFGESLGTAVAVDLAVKTPVAGVALESGFTSVRDMASVAFPWIPKAFVSDQFNSLAKISGLRAPVLIVHGRRDEIVPFEMGRRLFDAAPEPREFLEVPAAGHNDVYVVGGEKYRATISGFLAPH